ncbi:MAG: hypothetical protein LBE91_19510 [Tannerella sp.]|jgi:uncharacterized protein YjbJ (UPF0337 family)|nr:hypothetical protein [Tannerella sp.]
MEAAEEKIVGHAKEAIHALTDKKKNRWEKIGKFLDENRKQKEYLRQQVVNVIEAIAAN